MIMTNDFCIGSDGSVSSNNGSYACRLQHTSDRNIFIQIHALFHTTSSFTAEAYGFLAALYLLRAFYNYFHIIPPPATINSYIDYQPLIQRLSYGKETSIKHVNRRDSSLIREIHTVLDSLAITISRTHIKSHEYDKIDDYNLIPLPNFVNKCCDISAGLAYKCDLCSPPKTQQFPSTSVHVLHDQQIIDSEIQRKLLFQSYNEKMRKQINDKEDWDEDTFNLVHWNYYQQALSQSTADQRHSYLCITNRLWPTNQLLATRSKNGNTHDRRCFRCNRFTEDWAHVFCCPSDNASIAWTKFLSNLTKRLSPHFSIPMITVLTTGRRQWFTFISRTDQSTQSPNFSRRPATSVTLPTRGTKSTGYVENLQNMFTTYPVMALHIWKPLFFFIFRVFLPYRICIYRIYALYITEYTIFFQICNQFF
mmetsp:Transcript_24647/g.37449  ORF Transcript_24647/g.37449 Transcript_24647/m.37449 type:complete len:422 (+) Transcript_24647:2776-4041(+)